MTSSAEKFGSALAKAVKGTAAEECIDVTGAAVAPVRAWPAPRPAQRQTTRPELWRAGLRMWRERPFLGVGPDGFRACDRIAGYSAFWLDQALDYLSAAGSLAAAHGRSGPIADDRHDPTAVSAGFDFAMILTRLVLT